MMLRRVFSRFSSAPAFDFNKAVQDACVEYPAETKNTLFLKHGRWRDMCRAWNHDLAGAFIKYAGKSLAVTHLGTGKRALFFGREKNIFPGVANEGQYIFDHEFGHTLYGTTTSAKDLLVTTHKREIEADSFAAIRGLSKRTLSVEEVKKISYARAQGVIEEGLVGHFTSLALDAIVADVENFKPSLTPQEIMAIAAAHAEKFYSDEADLSHLQDVFRQGATRIRLIDVSTNPLVASVVKTAKLQIYEPPL